MLPGQPRAAHVYPAEWLAKLHTSGATCLATELDDPAYLRNLGEKALVRLPDLRPAREEDTLRSAFARVGDEVPP